MTTDPTLPERAYQAGRAGTAKPEAHGETERRVVDEFYSAGARDAGRPPPGSAEEWQQREGRVVEAHKRAVYGTSGPEQRGTDTPHDPGG